MNLKARPFHIEAHNLGQAAEMLSDVRVVCGFSGNGHTVALSEGQMYELMRELTEEGKASWESEQQVLNPT